MVRQIALGFAVGFVGLVTLARCGTATVLECQAQALRVLPARAEDIDVGVALELRRRILACQAQDGGVP